MVKKALILLICLLLAGCAAGPEPTTVPTTTVHVHAYTETVVPATCMEAGKLVFACVCGDSYEEAGDPAAGHSYEPVITEPTWDEQGFTTHTCVCGDSFVDSYTDPLKITLLPPPESGEPMHFFDDAAFVGDSISMRLRNYHLAHGTFGNAMFFTVSGYSVHYADQGRQILPYQGRQLALGEALKACGAKKVFLLLGMNDVGYYGIEPTMEKWVRVLEEIRTACPDIVIYIQSGTPIFRGGERVLLTNRNMDAYNVLLKEFAEENGCYFIDIATALKDEYGGLKREYCCDAYVHLTDKACEVWIDTLWKYFRGDET